MEDGDVLYINLPNGRKYDISIDDNKEFLLVEYVAGTKNE